MSAPDIYAHPVADDIFSVKSKPTAKIKPQADDIYAQKTPAAPRPSVHDIYAQQPLATVGSLVFNPAEQQEFLKVTPQLRAFAPTIASAFGGGVTVTSVESGPHKGSAHREGRAIDVVPSFQIGDNPQAKNAVANLIRSGKLEALGTEASIVNDPELKQLAAQYNVDLFEDDVHTGATGAHFHIQVPSAGSAEARFRGQSDIYREPISGYGKTPQEPRAATAANPKDIYAHPGGPSTPFTAWLAQTAKSGLAHGLRLASDAAQTPLSVLNATLGAPQRFMAGQMAENYQQYQKPVYQQGPSKNPFLDRLKEAGGGIYGVFHPNDPNVQAQAQQDIGWDKLHLAKPPQALEPIHEAMLGFAAKNAGSPAAMGTGLFGAAVSDPRNVRKVANAISDMGFQTATDPLTYAGGAGLFRNVTAPAFEKMLSYLGTRGLTSQNRYLRNFMATFIPNPKERVALTTRGQAAVSGIRNAENAAYAKRANAYRDLLARNADALRQQQVPDEVEQELLRQGYRYGTPDLREETLAAGFKPNPEDLSFNGGLPGGILNYHLKEDYFPHAQQFTLPDPLREIGEAYEIPKPKAGFEKPQMGEQVGDPLGSMTYRFAAGNAAIRQRMMQARMSRELGLPFQHPWAESLPEVDRSRIDSHVVDTAKAYDILEKPLGENVERVEWLQPISNIGRDTLIGANPVPHSKNISILATLAGGIPGFARGLKYAFGGIPNTLKQRLEESGGSTHFMLTDPAKFSPVRILPQWYRKQVVQNSLDSIDMGMRAARLEQIDRQYGNTLTEFEKMQKVNEDIGAYHDSPAYVRILRDFGGQFPQWHGYIVPTAVGRAILRDPQRIETWIRAQDAMNKDIVNGDGNQGYNIEFGGPITEMGEVTQVPGQLANAQWPTWLTSPSMTGPIGSMIAHSTQQPQSFGVDPNQGIVSQIVPYFNIIAPQFGINPYGSKAPPNVRSLAAFFGAYPKAEQSVREKMIRDFMERGLDRFHADLRVRRLFQMIRR